MKGGRFKMKTFKKVTCMMLLIIVSLGLTGCYDLIYLSSDEDTTSTTEPIVPNNENIKKISTSAVCYFGYLETDDSSGREYLVGETHTIDYTNGDYEEEILKELAKGPDQQGNMLFSPIADGTTFKVIKKEEDRFITVIVSKLFLNAPSDFPTDWKTSSDYVDKYNRIKRLAVYSIVDTLTETGKYDRVQILMDNDGTGVGSVPTRGELGFTDVGNQYELLEALYRDTDIIFTPENALSTIMYYFKTDSLDNLYDLIMLVDLDSNKKPTQEEVVKTLENLNINVLSYEASNAIVSPDGLTATVILNGEIQIGSGSNIKTKDFKNTTVRLIEEDGIWKIQYNDLIDLLTN